MLGLQFSVDRLAAPALALAIVAGVSSAAAEETNSIALAGGVLSMDAPAAWESVPPRNRILEHELAVTPPAGVEAKAARLTMMAAGGSVQANITRWIGQFRETDGGANRDAGAVTNTKAGDLDVTIVDVSGTYLESAGGPFGPKTPRPNYRLLGAIVPMGSGGGYFLKLVGPADTVDPAVAEFRSMVDTIRRK